MGTRTAGELAAALREMATTYDPPAMYYRELLEEAAAALDTGQPDVAAAADKDAH